MMDGPSVSLRTLKPIKKDEEVFISYIDVTNPYARRQSELKARWFFQCNCTKCQSGPTLREDLWAIEPHALSHKLKEVVDGMHIKDDFAHDPANYVGETQSERLVAAIQGKAFADYEAAQRERDPNEAITKIENAMGICYQSGVWPLDRQPFPALRDDLIVNMIAVGKFDIAWAQCAKRYKHTLAQLYPVPFHPVRVVLLWQTAMVALYVGSKPGGIGTPGIEMGIIAMMLVRQVLDVCSKSHGADSAFTRSVAGRADEITNQLRRGVGRDVNQQTMNRELELQRDYLNQMGDWVQI